MALAPSLKVTRGRKFRMDGTVVATNIHHPTDSPWRYDGVRVRGRTLVKAKQVVQQVPSLARHAFRDRTRSVKRQMQRLMAAARQRGRPADERMRMAYQRLLTMTTAMVEQAERVGAVLKSPAVQTGQRLAATLGGVVPLVPQLITQTTRRVGHGEAVPAAEKLVSLFEPHTAMIRTGKPGQPTACGRVMWVDEIEGGVISRYAVLDGNPAEEAPLPLSLAQHLRVFNHPPRLLAGDRGRYTTAHERHAATHGVKEVVLPKPECNRPSALPMRNNGGSGVVATGGPALKAASAG